jgi:hypothetical protein
MTMNGQNMDDLVGRGYPYFDIMGRGGAAQYDAMGNVCGPFGQPLGYPVLGCPPIACVDPMQAAAAAFAARGGYGAPALPGPAPMPMPAPVQPDAMAGWGGPGFAGAFGPGLVDPWSCFGPPVNPLVVQQVEQPARFLRPRCPQGIRAEPIGLGCACIAPCEEVTLECCVSDITKVKELIIPSSVAFQLLVTDITVGRECFLQCGPMPASMFTEDSEVGDFDFPTANDGECISVTLKNISQSDVEVCVGARVLTVYY